MSFEAATQKLVLNGLTVVVYDDPDSASAAVATHIAQTIKEKTAAGKQCVLGLVSKHLRSITATLSVPPSTF